MNTFTDPTTAHPLTATPISTADTTPTATRKQSRVTLARVMRSEWIKFWSVRSTITTLIIGAVSLIGIGLLAASNYSDGGGDLLPGGEMNPVNPVNPVDISLAGLNFAQLAIGTLGALLMAGEYSTGMIRSSLTAVPKRLSVLGAKIGVFTGVTFVVGILATAITFTAGQAIIGAGGASWSDPGVARAVIGAAVVLTGSGILGIGLGAVLRSTSAAITTIVGVLFLLPAVASLLLPDSWYEVIRYLPADAASAFTTVDPVVDALAPWTGLAVFGAYVAATVTAAAVRLVRTDA